MGKKILRSLLIAFFITAISVILIGCSIALPTFDPSKLELEYKTTQIFDKNDNEMMSFQAQPGEHAGLNEVPKWISDGVVAVEDSRFYDHNGIDFRSIGRAIWRDILTRSAAEGGSTLTQQLAKNVYLTQDKTLSRKVKEVYLAAQIERNYSKEDILEMYLNRVYFGHGATGIKMAAEVYFDKGDHMKDLTLGESALLAGLPNAPSAYDPYVEQNIEAAIKRRNIVLDAMVKNESITQAEADKAKQEPVKLVKGKNIKGSTDNIKYPYYLDYILEEAEQKLDVPAEQILRGGVKVYTHLDPKFQESLEAAYQDPKNFPNAAADGQLVQGASVVLDPKTGGIAAIIGGRDKSDEHGLRGFNRASMAKVRPGSSFKPIVDYAPAIDTGFKKSTSLLNNKRGTKFGTYQPKNWKDYYTDTVPMTEAIQMSWNVPAASLLYEMGIDVGYKYATQNFGVPLDKEDANKLSIALGDVEVSPLDIAGAYTAFVPDNAGQRTTPFAIRSIQTDNGTELASIKTQQHQAIKPDTAKVMTKLMKLVVDSGTGTSAKLSGRDVAGKTGTTEMEGTAGNRDAWFAGYTSEYVMVTWMGFDKSDQQHYLRQGSELPASLFAKVMSQGLAGVKSKSFDTNVQEKAPDSDKEKDKEKEKNAIVKDLAASYDGSKVQLTWSPVDVEGVKYFLYRADKQPDGTAVNSIPLGEYSKPGFTDASLTPGKSYWYSVVVWKDGLELSKSNFAAVTIPGGKTENPQTPTQPGNGTQPGGTGGTTQPGTGTPQQPGTPTQPGTPDTGGTKPPAGNTGGGTTQPGTGGGGTTQGTGGSTQPGTGGQPSIPLPPPSQGQTP
ncbi:transglycosylase domain-containing protein [Tumebacillus permanentifrigoris]|uniref:Penicillin-binding protein 2A n=1 Tax=Tumebacillus permanentifrigoris TaxID=378543 RepID=A0A316DEH5_9BACL|nr:PBP1A family penicillin-binding protein [Tumebacillus permanentifrigoris]PWK14357.1 penicillin-binding protein 2A [Tumebacillus permanentifrigoris]